MNNVLVTGGCGFVGRHLVKRLLADGCRVTIVDNLSTGQRPDTWLPPNTRNCVFLRIDLRSYCRTTSVAPFDTVFHCAAVVGGRMTIDGDPLKVATDLSIDSEFFNWLARCHNPPGKIVYFSSSAVYPIALQTRSNHCALSESFVNFDGTKIGMPDSTYGWSKLTGEYLVRHAVKTYDLDIAIYRPFSGYGNDQDMSYPFPAIIERVRNRENPITIWGSGEQTRDFIHIDDCVDGVLATMHKMPPGDVLNLGTGVATSFMQLAEMAVVSNRDTTIIQNDPSKPEGVFARYADISKLSPLWQHKISLKQGIEMALDSPRKAGVV